MITQILHIIEAKLRPYLKFKYLQASFRRDLARQEEFCLDQLQSYDIAAKRYRAPV